MINKFERCLEAHGGVEGLIAAARADNSAPIANVFHEAREVIAANRELWLQFVTELCGLCGNTGIIDTRRSAISPAGFYTGALFYCLCPNGEAMRGERLRRIT